MSSQGADTAFEPSQREDQSQGDDAKPRATFQQVPARLQSGAVNRCNPFSKPLIIESGRGVSDCLLGF